MTTVSAPPAPADLRALVEACRATLTSCRNDLVKVAAGVIDSNQRIFTAVQVRSRNCNHCSVCAEAIAVGVALGSCSTDLAACVSLVRRGDAITVWSPCGSCRELLRDHNVGHVIVAEEHDELITVPTADLLPWP